MIGFLKPSGVLISLFFFNMTEALRDVVHTLASAEGQAQVQQARRSAGNDMLKTMQLVFPLQAQIQMDVVAKYGFTADGEGKFFSVFFFLKS